MSKSIIRADNAHSLEGGLQVSQPTSKHCCYYCYHLNSHQFSLLTFFFFFFAASCMSVCLAAEFSADFIRFYLKPFHNQKHVQNKHIDTALAYFNASACSPPSDHCIITNNTFVGVSMYHQGVLDPGLKGVSYEQHKSHHYKFRICSEQLCGLYHLQFSLSQFLKMKPEKR